MVVCVIVNTFIHIYNNTYDFKYILNEKFHIGWDEFNPKVFRYPPQERQPDPLIFIALWYFYDLTHCFVLAAGSSNIHIWDQLWKEKEKGEEGFLNKREEKRYVSDMKKSFLWSPFLQLVVNVACSFKLEWPVIKWVQPIRSIHTIRSPFKNIIGSFHMNLDEFLCPWRGIIWSNHGSGKNATHRPRATDRERNRHSTTGDAWNVNPAKSWYVSISPWSNFSHCTQILIKRTCVNIIDLLICCHMFAFMALFKNGISSVSRYGQILTFWNE